MPTNTLSAKAIKRSWHVIDADGKVLGRLATDVATKLQGKNKPNYVPYLDNGDYVVVTNAAKIQVTGKKAQQKTYARHSGFPGGFRVEKYLSLQARRPEEIIRHAVKGMLPHTKLGDKMIKKLYIVAGSENPYAARMVKGEE